jgi:hypothetical protein
MLPDHHVSVSTQNVFDGKTPIRFLALIFLAVEFWTIPPKVGNFLRAIFAVQSTKFVIEQSLLRTWKQFGFGQDIFNLILQK